MSDVKSQDVMMTSRRLDVT